MKVKKKLKNFNKKIFSSIQFTKQIFNYTTIGKIEWLNIVEGIKNSMENK